MKGLPKRVQDWDDERSEGNSLIVTLKYGWSFDPCSHEGVRGFDTVKDAREAIKDSHPCCCSECKGVIL